VLEGVVSCMASPGFGVQGQEVLERPMELLVEDVLGPAATLRSVLLIQVLVYVF
jgi:hypothetical protein